MSEEITEFNAPEVYVQGGLSKYYDIAKEAASEVPDLTTTKGRARVKSLSAKVSKAKALVVNEGQKYLAKLKSQPKIVEAEIRDFKKLMDQLRDDTRAPLTDWEEKKEAVEAEKQAKEEAERLDSLRESDHEMGILLHEKYDREKTELDRVRVETEERDQKDRDEKIRRDAVAKAEAETKAAIDREEAAKRAAIQAQEDKALSERRAEEAAIQAVKDADQAEERSREEAVRAADLATANEIARVALNDLNEKKEQEKRESNRRHVGDVRRRAKEAIIVLGANEELAKKIVLAISKDLVPSVTIQY